jgi:hypothetical protein
VPTVSNPTATNNRELAADHLLARLDRVRANGDGRWMAKCPAHDDGRASLSIRDADGRVLIHCFAGCEPGAVLAAVGLSLRDLFDKPLANAGPLNSSPRSLWHAQRAAFDALRGEVTFLAIVANDISRGESISPIDASRAAAAAGRISEACRVLYGK